MKKNTFFLLFIFIIFKIYCDEPVKSESSISKQEIKLGEKITLTVKIPELSAGQVIWQDMQFTDSNAELYDKKEYFRDNSFFIVIDFSFFKEGNYDDFNFTIPVNKGGGELIYVKSINYNLKVNKTLTDSQKENLKNIKDPSQIELKKEKEQAKFKYNFSILIIIFFIIIIIILITLIFYYAFYKLIFRKNSGFIKSGVPPYQLFKARIELICFDINDERKNVETKLSSLTEILKELLYGDFREDFRFFAPSETTKELIITLRSINFNENLINEINRIFIDIDMIKFAKNEFDYDKLIYFYNEIKKIGRDIHDYKLALTEKINNEIKKAELEKKSN